jgi:hypothetical protein
MVKVAHLLLVVAMFAVCGCNEKEPEKSNPSPAAAPNPTPTPTPNPGPGLTPVPGVNPSASGENASPKPLELPAEVIQDAWTKFENNPALPETNLKNKTLENTGRVTDIVKLKEGVNKGKWVLSMVSETNPKKGMTRCLFERAEDLESTAKGKVARVQGRFDSWNKDQHCLNIRDCILK